MEFINLALKQLEHENESAIVMDIFEGIVSLTSFIPFAKRFEYSHKFWLLIREVLLPKWMELQNRELVTLLMENLITYTHAKEALEIAAEWVLKSSSILPEQYPELKLNRNLSSRLLKNAFASVFLS